MEDASIELTQKIGNDLIELIRKNWSSSSPSSAGQPPAKVTGNLDSSLKMDSTGRDASGRFANSKNAKYAFIRVDTANGDFDDPNGRSPADRGNYAQSLEYGQAGHHAPRPFLEPAMAVIATSFGREAKRVLNAGFRGVRPP